MTKYSIFTHYYNDSIGKAVTNVVDCKWYPCLTSPTEYNPNPSQPYDHSYLQHGDMNQAKLEQDKETLEVLYISKDTTSSDDTDKYKELIIDESTIKNPKFDMIFIWDGLGYFIDDSNDKNQLYFDKMKRIEFKPWFFHSTYNSLKAAMTKAEKLVDLFGKNHIMIGKEINLDQYIDIV